MISRFLAVDALVLYRFMDPERGPRVLPLVPVEELSQLNPDDRFIVNEDASKISLSVCNGTVEIGDRLIYTDIKRPLN